LPASGPSLFALPIPTFPVADCYVRKTSIPAVYGGLAPKRVALIIFIFESRLERLMTEANAYQVQASSAVFSEHVFGEKASRPDGNLLASRRIQFLENRTRVHLSVEIMSSTR
jgi:hypothetical protein